MERFNGRILGVTTKVALQWGGILGNSEKKGKSLPVVDALIAATAITNGLTLVTRNTSDTTASGAHFFDPWR
ncbi:MAG: PIN domain-containing protein [Chlorobium sp.]